MKTIFLYVPASRPASCVRNTRRCTCTGRTRAPIGGGGSAAMLSSSSQHGLQLRAGARDASSVSNPRCSLPYVFAKRLVGHPLDDEPTTSRQAKST